METNKPLILNAEEAKKYLEDYIRIFLRILVITIAADIKKRAIVNLEDYLTIFFFEYCVEKTIAQVRHRTVSSSI